MAEAALNLSLANINKLVRVLQARKYLRNCSLGDDKLIRSYERVKPISLT